jgi:hypothetical protein
MKKPRFAPKVSSSRPYAYTEKNDRLMAGGYALLDLERAIERNDWSAIRWASKIVRMKVRSVRDAVECMRHLALEELLDTKAELECLLSLFAPKGTKLLFKLAKLLWKTSRYARRR